MSSQGVDMAGHGDTAVAFGVELKHHSDKPGLRLIDLQGGLAVHHSFVVAVWGVGHIAPILNRHLEAAAQAFGDNFVLPAADEGFQLGVLLVDLIGQIIDLFRGNDQGAGLPEGVQDDALVLHPAAGEPVQIHAQDSVILTFLYILEEPEHLGPRVERFAADDLWVLLQDVEAVGGGVVVQGLLVLGQHLVGGHALLHPGFAEVDGGVQAFSFWYDLIVHGGLLTIKSASACRFGFCMVAPRRKVWYSVLGADSKRQAVGPQQGAASVP